MLARSTEAGALVAFATRSNSLSRVAGAAAVFRPPASTSQITHSALRASMACSSAANARADDSGFKPRDFQRAPTPEAVRAAIPAPDHGPKSAAVAGIPRALKA